MKTTEFAWAFFWEGRDGDYIHMKEEPVFGDGPGFHQGDEIEFVADDGKQNLTRGIVTRRVFEVDARCVRVYLRKI